MHRTCKGYWLSCFLFIALIFAACGGGGSSAEEQARETEWAWLSEAKGNLDAKRQELKELRSQVAEASEEAEGEEAAAEEGMEEEIEGATADPQAALEALEEEIDTLSEEFGQRLVQFINADPMIEGEPPTERQLAALRMKSDEDMVLAREWIEKGGDYKRAIEIYKTALMFDPDNERLQAALERAEADRYMSQERFAQVEKGMTQDQVRALLGQVNTYNIRDYSDRDVTAWFYPTAEDGSAAGVFFRPDKRSGERQVYQVNFDAVQPGGESDDGGG